MIRTLVKVIPTYLLVAAVLVSAIDAAVVVNEVLVNEPSGIVLLEWFELYNDSDSPVDLNFFQAQVDADLVSLSGSVAARGYAVVCRDSANFVDFWIEDPANIDFTISEGDFSLPNQDGTIQLLRAGTPESQLNWPAAGADGISWERVLLQSPDVGPSLDLQGGTPGRVNSVSPMPLDLSLDSVAVFDTDNGAVVRFTIVNRGLNLMLDDSLTIYHYDTDQPDNRDNVIVILPIPPIDTGFTTIIQEGLIIPGYYSHLGAYLGDDDRLDNNQLDFFLPGLEYPPVVISEILANPKSPLTTEWIELYNCSDSTFDLNGWLIGDAAGLHPVTALPVNLAPGEYLVLADDTLALSQFYNALTSLIVEPQDWPRLTDTGDVVRLVDSYDIETDRFEYSSVFDDNHTWSRSDLSLVTRWGRSMDPGGTPGLENTIRLQPTETGLSVTAEPQVFSPDGDRYDDETVITIGAPSAADYTLKVYDREGRAVRTFEDRSPDLADGGMYSWDGHSDSGDRLPVGIYIIYFEAGGVQSLKKTVVIAR